MTKDYRGETGIIGKWKGYDVFVLTKEQYVNLTNKSDYTVYVISNDNDKMVLKGQIIGNLIMSEGTVIESRQGEYRPVCRVEVPQTSTSTSTSIGEYDQYATIVNEFFKNLKDPTV